MIGYKDGSLKNYDITGTISYSCIGHNTEIVKIESIGYYGWITLDSSGKAMTWSLVGEYHWLPGHSIRLCLICR